MRDILFVPKAFKEYQEWIATDRKTALRIGDLIKDILRSPFDGIGKPKLLKHEFAGCWSRKIDQGAPVNLFTYRYHDYYLFLLLSL